MTADISVRNHAITIDILDSAATNLGTVDLTEAFVSLNISTPQLDTQAPDGYKPFNGSLTLKAGNLVGFPNSLDPRDTAASPSGARIFSKGNRVNIRLADTSGALSTGWPDLYITEEPDPNNRPRPSVVLSLGDFSQLTDNDDTPEGDDSGIVLGTTYTRSQIANSILAVDDLTASSDTVSAYPMTVKLQKMDRRSRHRFVGGLMATAGYTYWIDSDNNTRFTQIDLNQAAPSLSLTIGGDDGDEVREEGWKLVNNANKPPRKLTVIGEGGVAEEIQNPSEQTDSSSGDGFTSRTVTERTEYDYGTTPTKVHTVVERQAASLILTKTCETVAETADSVVVAATETPNTDTALRDYRTYSKVTEYENIKRRKTAETTVERIVRGRAGNDAWRLVEAATQRTVAGASSASNDFQNAFNQLESTTIVAHDYSRITDLQTERTESRSKAWCLVGWTGDRPFNYELNRTNPREVFTQTDTWEKLGGLTSKERWRHKRVVRQPQGAIKPPGGEYEYRGNNADIMVDDPYLSFDRVSDDGSTMPPEIEYQTPEYSESRAQYSGSATFTPTAGDAFKNREETISISGPHLVSDDQASFFAELVGLFRHGRAGGAKFVGALPDWLLNGSYQPAARIDVTVNGEIRAYVIDGWDLFCDTKSTVWGCFLVFLGVVGVAPSDVVPPTDVAITVTNLEFLPPIEDNPVAVQASIPVTNLEFLPPIEDNPVATVVTPVTNLEFLPPLEDNPVATVVTPVTNLEFLPPIEDNPVAVETAGLFPDVQLLLHMEGADGSTTFVDSSSAARTPSAVGLGTEITTAQFKYGLASAGFDGVISAIEYADSIDFTMPGDFSVEVFVRSLGFAAVDGGANRSIVSLSNSLGITGPALLFGTGGQVILFAGGIRITSTPLSLSTWHHVAWYRVGGVHYIAIDGIVQAQTYSNATTLDPTIVRLGASVSASVGNFEGQLDEFRLITGQSPYGSTDFTPPTAAHPDS